MSDYTIYYKDTLQLEDDWPTEWDVFVSAYTSARRVRQVFEKVKAAQKHWLVFAEYGYAPAEYPAGRVFAPETRDEADFIRQFWETMAPDIASKSICVDITGFIRPYLCFLVRWFVSCGIRRFDAIYTEPSHYARREETKFSGGPIVEVRQIRGFEGNHMSDAVDSETKDVLIINVGYDDQLIAHVAESKESARKVQLFGFPSLRADMYQENVLRVHRAAEAVGDAESYYAPANDPFVTASVLREIVSDWVARGELTNLYLCPLATKPQTLGFALYYVNECLNSSSSMLFPFRPEYDKETSKGVSRVWKYTVELPAVTTPGS